MHTHVLFCFGMNSVTLMNHLQQRCSKSWPLSDENSFPTTLNHNFLFCRHTAPAPDGSRNQDAQLRVQCPEKLCNRTFQQIQLSRAFQYHMYPGDFQRWNEKVYSAGRGSIWTPNLATGLGFLWPSPRTLWAKFGSALSLTLEMWTFAVGWVCLFKSTT